MDGLKTLNDDETLCWPPEAVTAARQAQQEAEHHLEYFSSDWVYTPPPMPKERPECPAGRCNHIHARDRQGKRREDYRPLPVYYISSRGKCFDRWLLDRVNAWRSFCAREGLSVEDFPRGFTYLR